MRILWHSNAPWVNSGYGNQTNTFIWRLRELGHQVTVSCLYGLQRKPMTLDGIQMLPGGRDKYSNDILPAHAQYVKADVVITLVDAQVMEHCATSRVNWYPWLPVDSDPLPPDMIQALETAVQPIAFSRFGEAGLRQAGFEPLYVPHGIDTKVFCPVGQAGARRALGCPEEVFLTGIVSANRGHPSRKAFDQQIRAFAAFHSRHPDSMLYLHTDLTEIGKQCGEDVERIVELAGIPARAVARVDPYRYATGLISSGEMARLYSALDVLMDASRGEGFGIPIIEAQACGIPVITTDFSAMRELVFAGWAVGYVDRFFYQNTYQVIPSVDDLVDALQEAYRLKRSGKLAQLRAQARQGALAYDADRVTQMYWKPVLEGIERRIKGAQERLKPVVVEAA